LRGIEFSSVCLAVAVLVGCGNPEPPQAARPVQRPLAAQVKIESVPEAPAAAPRKPVALDAFPQKELGHTNILLITVDALRADRLGTYGHTNATSPNIDALAASGAVFEYALAPKGSTWPSLATILTGVYPVTHGVRYNGMALASEHDTLAEMLAPAGYTSAVFIANGGNQKWEGFETRQIIKEEPRDRGVTDAALPWIDQHAGEKFFLWLHYFAPHGPYTPMNEFDAFTDPKYSGDIDGAYDTLTRVFVRKEKLEDADLAYINGLYDGEVLTADHEISRVIEKVASLGLLNDTLIVISADHGEEMYDHHNYFHHQASLYEGTLRVPLIVRLPGKVPAGTRCATPVSVVDIVPTVLDIAGVPHPQNLQGKALTPVFEGQALDRGPIFGEWGDKMLYVRTATHKYIYNPSGFQPPVKREREAADSAQTRNREHTLPMKNQELYDVTSDPKELKDLSETSPELRATLQDQLKSGYIEKYGWKLENKAEEDLQNQLDDETRKELEALGYVI